MANTTLTDELAARGVKAMTASNITGAGGDTTARTAGQTNATAIAQLQALVQTLQAAVRTIGFTAAAYTVNEGPSGVTTNLTAIMKRTGDLSAPLAATTKFIAGTLDASDFASGSLPGDLVFNFAAGSDTATASDVIKGDDIAEPDETLTRFLVAPPGYSFGAITSYTGNVLNDESATKVSINGTPPTTGKVGTAYSFTPTTANGAGTKSFALSGGSLLAGLAFSTSTGAISGTPTASGSMANLVVTVTDGTGSASTTPTTVTIAAATTPVSISGTPPTTGTVGTAYVYAPATANGSGTKTFALSGGPLLSGLTFSSTTGGISGTPTVAGSMPNLVVTVTDSSGSASTAATTVTISAVATGTARSYGPTAIADTGFQEMGPLDQTAHFEANNTSYTGTFSEGFTVYLGLDTNDDNPNVGLRFSSIGNSQYTQCDYRSGGAWVPFANNRGGVNWGRELLVSDKVDIAFENGSTVAMCRLNGVAFPSPGANGTVSSANFALAFPNGPGKYSKVLRVGGNTAVADGWSTKLTGRFAA